MRIILAIAKRELRRVRGRFSGRSRPLVFMLLGMAALISTAAFRDGPNLGQGLYHIGVAPDGPPLTDRRFDVRVLDPAEALSELDTGNIDAYVTIDQVDTGRTPRSPYAAGALKRYLEQQELARLSTDYTLDLAFPLRIEVNYLTTTAAYTATIETGQLAQLLPNVQPSNSDRPLIEATPESDAAVREQLQAAVSGNAPEIRYDPADDKEIIIPSLLTPPLPFAQVLVAFIYILPVSFVSVFFVSSFMEEKINRRLTILLSSPVTPLQIILGKLLPYAVFAVLAGVSVTVIAGGDVLLALAILMPVILFIFAIYLMVPMLYRTFKDTTFISMLATALTTTYLIFPAVFSGVNDLAYISPLTLLVKMYRHEAFGLREYLFSVVPMAALFGLSLYAATRVLNEEYLTGYKPLYRKVADAIFLLLDRHRPYLSIFLLSLVLIPLVYMVQLALLAMATNLPLSSALAGVLIIAAIVEEIAKSIGIVTLLDRQLVRSGRSVIALAFLSALGFLIGEKLLLLISLSVVSESLAAAALFSTGALVWPLLAHFVFTTIVCGLRARFRWRYWVTVLIGAAVHVAYNWLVAGGLS